jgi:hypothetical protein
VRDPAGVDILDARDELRKVEFGKVLGDADVGYWKSQLVRTIAELIAAKSTRLTNLVEQITTNSELEQKVQSRNIPLTLLCLLDKLVVNKLKNVRVAQRLVHLHLLLQFLDIRRVLSGYKEVDDLACCYAALFVVDCAEHPVGLWSARVYLKRSCMLARLLAFVLLSAYFEKPPPPISWPMRYPAMLGYTSSILVMKVVNEKSE